jgi:hypothetical protein
MRNAAIVFLSVCIAVQVLVLVNNYLMMKKFVQQEMTRRIDIVTKKYSVAADFEIDKAAWERIRLFNVELYVPRNARINDIVYSAKEGSYIFFDIPYENSEPGVVSVFDRTIVASSLDIWKKYNFPSIYEFDRMLRYPSHSPVYAKLREVTKVSQIEDATTPNGKALINRVNLALQRGDYRPRYAYEISFYDFDDTQNAAISYSGKHTMFTDEIRDFLFATIRFKNDRLYKNEVLYAADGYMKKGLVKYALIELFNLYYQMPDDRDVVVAFCDALVEKAALDDSAWPYERAVQVCTNYLKQHKDAEIAQKKKNILFLRNETKDGGTEPADEHAE